MAKEIATANATPKKADRKVRRQVEKAQTAKQRAERKVGKLQVRLRQAESKLAKRMHNLSAVQSRVDTVVATPAPESRKAKKAKPQPPAPASAKQGKGKGKAKPETTPEQRLAAINMVVPGEGVVSGSTAAAPVAAETIPSLHAEDEQPISPVAPGSEAPAVPADEQLHPAQAKSVAARIHRPRPDVASAE